MRSLTLVSGGQTGVDRGALKAARDLGLPIRGWCPPGRVAEDGRIPDRFPLLETPRDRSPTAPHLPRSQRTEWNVRDADAVLILRPVGRADASGADAGTGWTALTARRLGRPLLECDPRAPEAVDQIVAWLHREAVEVIDVAGPSETSCPGIERTTHDLLRLAFTRFLRPRAAQPDVASAEGQSPDRSRSSA
ncbi:MAG: putative molybdenum carrier protein [Acidobacteriota bacterium]